MSNSNTRTTQSKTWFFTPLAVILPVFVAAAVLYRLDSFEPEYLPVNDINRSPLTAPLRNDHMRLGSEEVAKGQVLGPEDFVYDAVLGVVYTSCEDGWIKRVTVNESVADSVVENWVNTGGRPLGLAFYGNGDLIVADAEKMSGSNSNSTRTWPLFTRLAIVLPVFVAAAVLYRLDSFEPVHIPVNELNRSSPLTAPLRNDHMRLGSEQVAKGQVLGPEDFVYDAAMGAVYTSCEDGWIKRVTVNESVADSVVENWVNTGGRPLGLAFDGNGHLIVADAEKGLLRVTREKEIEVLATEIDGLKFKLTDGVDIAHDGTIYFTDASHKYSVKDSLLDIFEGNPNGRFLSYNPTTKKTTLLASDLYFPNGVAVSPDQHFVVFCETVLMNCKKYYIKGPKKGSIEKFCDLPGMADNIHYDGQGQYWIGIATASSPELDILLKYPFIRKVLALITKHVSSLNVAKNGGIITVDLEGKPTAHYYDPKLSLTAGIKIGNHIYCGSILYSFIIRLDIEKYPALPTTN